MKRGEAAQPRYIKVRVSLLVVVAAVIFAAGFVHIVRGGKVRGWPGIEICAKESWALGNTFMDTDDYIGQPRLVAALDDGVVRALIRCRVLRIQSWPLTSDLTASASERRR